MVQAKIYADNTVAVENAGEKAQFSTFVNASLRRNGTTSDGSSARRNLWSVLGTKSH